MGAARNGLYKVPSLSGASEERATQSAKNAGPTNKQQKRSRVKGKKKEIYVAKAG